MATHTETTQEKAPSVAESVGKDLFQNPKTHAAVGTMVLLGIVGFFFGSKTMATVATLTAAALAADQVSK